MRISDWSSDVCSSDLFDEDVPTVTGKGCHRPPFAPLFARLLELPDPVVMEIVAIVMGETLKAGSEAVEMIGLHLGTDMRRHWSADAAFFDQLRDREVLLAIVGEVAGADAASGNKDAKGRSEGRRGGKEGGRT